MFIETGKSQKFFIIEKNSYFFSFLSPKLKEINVPLVECNKCGTMYPKLNGMVRCNNKIISRCLCENKGARK